MGARSPRSARPGDPGTRASAGPGDEGAQYAPPRSAPPPPPLRLLGPRVAPSPAAALGAALNGLKGRAAPPPAPRTEPRRPPGRGVRAAPALALAPSRELQLPSPRARVTLEGWAVPRLLGTWTPRAVAWDPSGGSDTDAKRIVPSTCTCGGSFGRRGAPGVHCLPAARVIVTAHVAGGILPQPPRTFCSLDWPTVTSGSLPPCGTPCLPLSKARWVCREASTKPWLFLRKPALWIWLLLPSAQQTLEEGYFHQIHFIFRGTSTQCTVQKSVSKMCFLTAEHSLETISILSRHTWPGVGRQRRGEEGRRPRAIWEKANNCEDKLPNSFTKIYVE